MELLKATIITIAALVWYILCTIVAYLIVVILLSAIIGLVYKPAREYGQAYVMPRW